MHEYPVQVGSMLFTLVDPHRGHEVAYNRWYERDHFYAGCLVGPWLFSGGRWVATRALKQLRYPADSPLAKPVDAGSYLAVYWIHEGHHDQHRAWANPQAHWLYQNDRGFNERTHVHTLMYMRDWTHYRDADPVPVALALDHGYPGMVTVAVERNEGVPQEKLDRFMRETHLPKMLAGSPIASCTTWSPIPQGKAPMAIPVVENIDRLDLQLYFLDEAPPAAWDRFVALGEAITASGLGRVTLAAPFLATVPGTDRYTDELW
jgi:hypothetical protein